MTVSDKRKYDCTTCPYPRYKDGSVIFCDVCIRRILDEQKEENVADEQQVTVNLPTVEEQIEMLAEAEDEKSSAFVISQEDIDSVLLSGSGFQNGKYRIYRQFQKNEDSKS